MVAAILIGRQFDTGNPVDWQGPCLLGLVGVLSLGVGIFMPLQAEDGLDCEGQRHDGDGTLDADGGTD